MDRASLLAAVAASASAAALGQDDTEEQRGLNGKRLEVRIRFGCATDAQTQPLTGRSNVRFDDENRTLRVRIAPDLTLDDPRVAATVGESVEAVEGFWLSRPWLLQDGCPVVQPVPAATDEAPGEAADPKPNAQTSLTLRPAQRVGLARFFTSSDARTSRRDGRAYETVKVLGEDEQPSRVGYNLVLSGRLRQLPGGRVIGCRASSADTPPDCLVSAEFDRVWIEVPGTGAILGEWGR